MFTARLSLNFHIDHLPFCVAFSPDSSFRCRHWRRTGSSFVCLWFGRRSCSFLLASRRRGLTDLAGHAPVAQPLPGRRGRDGRRGGRRVRRRHAQGQPPLAQARQDGVRARAREAQDQARRRPQSGMEGQPELRRRHPRQQILAQGQGRGRERRAGHQNEVGVS